MMLLLIYCRTSGEGVYCSHVRKIHVCPWDCKDLGYLLDVNYAFRYRFYTVLFILVSITAMYIITAADMANGTSPVWPTRALIGPNSRHLPEWRENHRCNGYNCPVY
jgi:hypothetical protein